MSPSCPVHRRWLAALLLVSGTLVSHQGAQARNLHKRSFLELGCRGNFEQSYLARLERVCEECFGLYREPQVYNICRENCFKNENFLKCAEALLLHDEMESLKGKVDYLYSR
ncbi:crustacean hyperglycemic hormones [Ixodes scapularis]|nr:crustacean hyperglycemic hormones [Ixodes scapularis]XP_029827279.1 crustacean hyperglycemic hormones [Ixodes scapularis]